MNEILEELVTKINHTLTFLDVKKKGGLKRLITINHVQFENALTLISLGELIVLLKDKCNLSIEYNYCSRVLNQERKNQGHQSTKKQLTVTKGNTSVTEKKPSTEPLQKGDNAESKISDSFKDFKNLNRISLKLIDEYNIDLETLKTLGVMTIQDRSIVESKIKNYCEAIDDERFKEEFSDILKKD
ncbi:hypothetical protein AB6G07_10515 [Providencia stuartii]|uniref:hypothetical protein n=1 Tax=Providencia stuartii TaxID=588 RepID=UPI0034DD94CA